MKKFRLLSLCILTACAGAYSNQINDQLGATGKKEGEAWGVVLKQLEAQCPSGTEDKPLPRSQALERQECYEKLIHTHIMPVAFDSAQLMDYMANGRRISIDYKEGKISRDRANLKLQENWNAYMKALTDKADKIYQQAYQQDKALAEQQRQYFQNLSQQLNQAELERQKAQKVTKPTNTNCHAVAGSLRCSTW